MAIRYVDSSATGAHNGTSWADAWTNFGQVSGLSGGDIVYISGGPTGQTRNYPLTAPMPPVSGSSATNRITYQIGQDSQHNGTAVFTNAGAGSWMGVARNIIVSGDAGDNQQHFSAAGFFRTIDGGENQSFNYKVSYFKTPKPIAPATYSCTNGIQFSMSGGIEIDHFYIYVSDPNSDHGVYLNQMQGTGFDQNLVHDGTLWVPRSSSGSGADAYQTSGIGYSLYNLKSYSYLGYTGGQHQDGWQITGGDQYVKVYNTEWVDMANYALFPAVNFGGLNHVWIYNNICRFTDAALAATAPPQGIVAGIGQSGLVVTFNDVIILNNLVVDYINHTAIVLDVQHVDLGSHLTLTNCIVANNVGINSGGFYFNPNGITGTPSQPSNYFSFSSDQATSRFRSYAPFSPGNDFHLTSAATELIGRGTNYSSVFTTDFEGNTRGSTWDIGPYKSGTVIGGLPRLTVDKASLDFGVVMVGANPTLSVSVSNSGSAGTGIQTASIDAPFVIISGGAYNLAPQQSQVIEVGYSSSSKGIHVGDLKLPGGAGITVNLSGKTYPLSPSLTFSPDDALVIPPFVVDSSAHTISQPSQITNPSQAGQLWMAFTAPETNSYVVKANVNASNDSSNSLYISIPVPNALNKLPIEPDNVWDIIQFTSGYQSRTASWRGNGDFQTPQFNPKTWSLTAGTVYSLIICGREANVGLGQVTIAPYTPIIPPAPAAPVLTTPADAATNQSVSPTLNWTEADTVSGFSVFFGITNPPPKVSDVSSATLSYSPTALGNSTTYYWKVRAFLNWSSQGQSGQVASDSVVRSFVTEPIIIDPNQPPQGTISANVTSAVGPVTVHFTLTSFDSDGTVASGVFDPGDGSGTVTIPNPAGAEVQDHTYGAVTVDTTYNATWQITDNDGLSSTIATRPILVTKTPANQLPSASMGVSLTASYGPFQETFTLGSSDVDGSITKGVLDYGDGSPALTVFSPASSIIRNHTYAAVGVDTTYAATWTVTDNRGGTDVATQNILVKSTPQPPTVMLTAPVEGTVYTAPATINLAATAAAGTNPIAKVEFYINAVKVGEDATAPYTFSEAGVAAGAKVLLAKAYDNQGSPLTANSQSVNVFVIAAGTHVVPNIVYVT